uniref:Uncharacterized protein n=1 Tax=viral metagenome TaxID=1070528 RepID=A0A6C0H892_9ZZZZ
MFKRIEQQYKKKKMYGGAAATAPFVDTINLPSPKSDSDDNFSTSNIDDHRYSDHSPSFNLTDTTFIPVAKTFINTYREIFNDNPKYSKILYEMIDIILKVNVIINNIYPGSEYQDFHELRVVVSEYINNLVHSQGIYLNMRNSIELPNITNPISDADLQLYHNYFKSSIIYITTIKNLIYKLFDFYYRFVLHKYDADFTTKFTAVYEEEFPANLHTKHCTPEPDIYLEQLAQDMYNSINYFASVDAIKYFPDLLNCCDITISKLYYLICIMYIIIENHPGIDFTDQLKDLVDKTKPLLIDTHNYITEQSVNLHISTPQIRLFNKSLKDLLDTLGSPIKPTDEGSAKPDPRNISLSIQKLLAKVPSSSPDDSIGDRGHRVTWGDRNDELTLMRTRGTDEEIVAGFIPVTKLTEIPPDSYIYTIKYFSSGIFCDELLFINYIFQGKEVFVIKNNHDIPVPYVIKWEVGYKSALEEKYTAVILLKDIIEKYCSTEDSYKLKTNTNLECIYLLYLICYNICITKTFNGIGSSNEDYKKNITATYKKIETYLKNLPKSNPHTINYITYNDIYKNIFSIELYNNKSEQNCAYRNFLFYPTQLYLNIYVQIIDDSETITYTSFIDFIRVLHIESKIECQSNDNLIELYNKLIKKLKEIALEKKLNINNIDLCIIYPVFTDGDVFDYIPESIQTFTYNPVNHNNLEFKNGNPIVDGNSPKNGAQINIITNTSTITDYYTLCVAYNIISDEYTKKEFKDNICKILSGRSECFDLLMHAINNRSNNTDDYEDISNKLNSMDHEYIQNELNNVSSIFILMFLVFIFKFKIIRISSSNINMIESLDSWSKNFGTDSHEITNNMALMKMLKSMIERVPLNLINNENMLLSYKQNKLFRYRTLPERINANRGGAYKLSKINTNFKNSINHQLYNITNDINKNSLFIKKFNKQVGGGKSDLLDKLELEMDKYIIISTKLEALKNMFPSITNEDHSELNKSIEYVKTNEKIIKDIIKIFLYYKNLKKTSKDDRLFDIKLPEDFDIRDDDKRIELYQLLKKKLIETTDINTSIIYEFKKIVS